MRVVIADDEAPARRKLRQLLAKEEDVGIVAEAADGAEAVAAIRAAHPDVVFLDIQMPRLDGFGVIAEIGVEAMPLIVFVTAFDEHALQAFEVHAVDYLLKPFAPSRLARLVERLRQRCTASAASAATAATAGIGAAAPADPAQFERLLAALRPPREYPRQILVEREEGRQALLAVDDIDVVRAEGNYLRFLTAQGEHRRRGTLRELAERLDPARFLRLNRSEIVRLEAIRELQPWFHGDARVVLRSGLVLTWSRRYRSQRSQRSQRNQGMEGGPTPTGIF
jgi:two-component system LytT family response regulator